jgi:hypothetical protein
MSLAPPAHPARRTVRGRWQVCDEAISYRSGDCFATSAFEPRGSQCRLHLNRKQGESKQVDRCASRHLYK